MEHFNNEQEPSRAICHNGYLSDAAETLFFPLSTDIAPLIFVKRVDFKELKDLSIIDAF